jgi:hypothetical protein
MSSKIYIIRLYLILLFRNVETLNFLAMKGFKFKEISFFLKKKLLYIGVLVKFYNKRQQLFGYIFKNFKIKILNYLCCQEKLFISGSIKKFFKNRDLMSISSVMGNNEVLILVIGIVYIKKLVKSINILFSLNESVVFKNIFYSLL